jgi:YbbR domain-containing protein
MKNIGLKLVSLLLACVVWVIVSAPRRESPQTSMVTASLSILAVPEHLIITTDIPGSVAVQVIGRRSDLRGLASQTLEATVDLTKAQAGDVVITLGPRSINVPEDIEVMKIVPNQIRFRIEQLRQRAVPIRPLLAGDPPDGYLVGEATVNPVDALVSGPASQILKLSEVTTERIIMTGRTATFVQNVAIVTDAPLVRILSPLNTQVTVPVLAEVGPNPPEAGTTDTTGTTGTTGTPESDGQTDTE